MSNVKIKPVRGGTETIYLNAELRNEVRKRAAKRKIGRGTIIVELLRKGLVESILHPAKG